MIFVTLVYVHTIVARVTNAASSVDSEYAAFSTVFSDDMVLQRSTQGSVVTSCSMLSDN